jgi:protein arginine N-methyltransferase 5
VGSGKGLILSKMMSACKSTGKKIKVYCIDKNPYPLQTLRRRVQRNKWTKMVEVVEADIKEYVMPEHPDIIFSELLGGLGDNELEPECIKWA